MRVAQAIKRARAAARGADRGADVFEIAAPMIPRDMVGGCARHAGGGVVLGVGVAAGARGYSREVMGPR